MCFAGSVFAIKYCLIYVHKVTRSAAMSKPTDEPKPASVGIGPLEDIHMRGLTTITEYPAIPFLKITSLDYATRQQAIQEVAKADPNNIQEVAASQLSIINSYYQSGLQQSQQSFKWSLIWGGIGLGFLIAAISFLLFRQPTEVAIASGIGGAIVEVFAGTYLYLYKHTSDQLAAFRASLESTQRLLLANSMCEKLEGEVEQTTRAELIRLMVNSAVQLTHGTLTKKEA
jgi:Cyanobacterial TRADD-N associated 2-Transmembrane domain